MWIIQPYLINVLFRDMISSQYCISAGFRVKEMLFTFDYAH